MAEPQPPTPHRRHTMRSLRSGQGVAPPAPVAPPSALGGRSTEDEAAFMAGLDKTIAAAAGSGQRVFVFRLRGAAKGLHRWADVAAIPNQTVERAVDELILGSNPDLALLRKPRTDLLGFAVDPQPGAVAERMGGRLMSGLANPLGPEGRRFIFSPRLGVCVFDPAQGSADQAVEAATRTLAQTTFETPFLVHNRYIATRSSRQDRTAEELPEALAGGRITVGFQPRVAVTDHKPVGLEALARWNHPERGPIEPLEFLQAAERHGHLVELGLQVRTEAVVAACRWQDDGLLDECRLWINLAPLELCHPDLIPSMAGLVDGRPNLSMGIEVADSRLVEDLVFLRIFDRLQELGIQLALDNVRPATLSFGRFRRLPLSMLNLDGQLVRSLPSAKPNRDLVNLICSHAAERGAAVTACGIETTEQLEILEQCGVDLVQGFAIAAVRSVGEMSDHLAKPTRTGSTDRGIG